MGGGAETGRAAELDDSTGQDEQRPRTQDCGGSDCGCGDGGVDGVSDDGHRGAAGAGAGGGAPGSVQVGAVSQGEPVGGGAETGWAAGPEALGRGSD
jgi:hypothetical protein